MDSLVIRTGKLVGREETDDILIVGTVIGRCLHGMKPAFTAATVHSSNFVNDLKMLTYDYVLVIGTANCKNLR